MANLQAELCCSLYPVDPTEGKPSDLDVIFETPIFETTHNLPFETTRFVPIFFGSYILQNHGIETTGAGGGIQHPVILGSYNATRYP